MYSYNTFYSPNLNGFSPYELVFWKKILIDLERDPNVEVSEVYKKYYELLNKRLEYLENVQFNSKKSLYAK